MARLAVASVANSEWFESNFSCNMHVTLQEIVTSTEWLFNRDTH